MSFSFNPGQEQTSAPAPSSNNGVPLLVVPTIPSIVDGGNVVEKISPFVFRNRNKSKTGMYFQSAVFLIFGSMLIASVGLFVYQGILNVQINSKKAELDTLQAGFKKLPIEEMQKLSSRLSVINKIMNERVSVRTALTIVEESANDSVTYNKFSLTKNKTKSGYDINFGGDTGSYVSLYQQVDLLKSKIFSGVLQKVAISGIGPLDKKGVTSFKIDATVAIGGVDPDGFTVIHKNNQASTTVDVVSSSTPSTVGSESTSSVISNVVQ